VSIKKTILLRVRIAFLVVALFCLAIVGRVVQLQYVDGAKWNQIARDIGLKFLPVKATRGNIYSDNGSLLATSVPYYRVAFDPTVAKDDVIGEGIDSLSYLLSSFFKEKSPNYYKNKILKAREANRKYLVLSRKMVGYQDKKDISEWPVFEKGRIGGGIIFEKVEKRLRPFSYLGSRTIGYINEDNHGAGLEYSFNRYLAGKDGQALFQKIAGSSWKPIYDGSDLRPVEGYDIETTIDINLQDVSESALFKALSRHQADYGCVVVMEVETGEIKAISNLSRGKNGKYSETYNYAVGSQGVREPGSTFKLASLMALFEDSELDLSDSINTGNGKYKFFDQTLRDHKKGGYGTITVKKAFEKSSNIAVAKLVHSQFGDKPQRYIDYLHHFGLTKPLGFHMIGEGKPKVKDTTDPTWSGITLPWMSIGHELELSPLHTLTFYNAVANGGKMIRPIIVKKVKHTDRLIKAYQTVTLKESICSDQTLIKLKKMLEGVVENGTAKNISGTHYKIAGKTGTAQKIVNGRYVNRYYTSFAGFFPSDQPKYSCIVVIDNPKGYQQEGSDVAAPVFKEIADKIYAQDLNIHDELPEEFLVEDGVFPVIRSGYYHDLALICNTLGISNHTQKESPEWVQTRPVSNSIYWKENMVDGRKVPDVRGMTLRDALYVLENLGLKVSYEGSGRVELQSEPPGARALNGSVIKLKLS
jgi:cell division protein FtsI (penicillin-binding protein 3)